MPTKVPLKSFGMFGFSCNGRTDTFEIGLRFLCRFSGDTKNVCISNELAGVGIILDPADSSRMDLLLSNFFLVCARCLVRISSNSLSIFPLFLLKLIFYAFQVALTPA